MKEIDKDLVEKAEKISLDFQKEYGWMNGQMWLRECIFQALQEVRDEERVKSHHLWEKLDKERSLSDRLVGALEYTSKELTRHKFYKAQGRLLTAVDEALEATGKAKGLVAFVTDVSNSSCNLHALRARKALAKWEKEK